MDGVMNDRTINVSNSKPRPMVVPHLSDNPQIADGHGRHGDGEYQPCVGHDLAGAAHRPDDAGLQPAPISCLNRETKSRL